jgi:hypothetical protein
MTDPYTAAERSLPETADQLRARIPGWGADLDPRDRPSVPRLQPGPATSRTGEGPPEQQPERTPRERSIEHSRLTPVFGTACPPRGLSGGMRRAAYARLSEAQAAHWVLLLAADRVDTVESALRSKVSRRPDNPVVETGVRSELTHGGLASRLGRGRADVAHHLVDPVIVAGPWLLGAVGVAAVARRLRSARR